jgi:hypothetical protein
MDESSTDTASPGTRPAGHSLQVITVRQAASITAHEMRSLLSTRTIDEVRGALLCGGILVFIVACIPAFIAVGLTMNLLGVDNLDGWQRELVGLVILLLLAAVATAFTVGLTVFGFSVTRRGNIPSWCTFLIVGASGRAWCRFTSWLDCGS